MSIVHEPGTVETGRYGHARPSLILAHLLKISGSGSTLDGIIVERVVDKPNSDSAPPQSAKHVLVLQPGNPATLEWRIGGIWKRALFAPGEAIITPAGLFTSPRWNAPVERIMLAVDPVLVNRVAQEMGRPGRVELMPRYQFRDDLLVHLMRSLVAEFEEEFPPNRVYADSLSHTLMAHLVRKYSVMGINSRLPAFCVPRRTLVHVLDYIDANLGAELSLKELAEIAGFSPSYFLALFKRSTGLAPHQYVITQRIMKAKALLTQTKMPIADIASQTGFADQSHLTRLMRRHTGLTPRILRAG